MAEESGGPELTRIIYQEAFAESGEGAIRERRMEVIEERLGLEASSDQMKNALIEGLKEMGLEGGALTRFARDKSLAEIALFAEYAVQFFGEDWSQAAAIPEDLRPKPGFPGTINRAVYSTDRDLTAIDQAIARVTGKPRPPQPRQP